VDELVSRDDIGERRREECGEAPCPLPRMHVLANTPEERAPIDALEVRTSASTRIGGAIAHRVHG
jgi:hypothetical protein